ncbi:Mu transposase C-terminal domain-containing protein [Azoarcus olearius]|uniref:Mu transposase C-terminal domain-containing protein n=1 Tax=Azoarcus sp. (strain BH72) TaxID=418699 RepID=UPI000806E3B9|nr:Mu transposase C-terminal domain-containing protein [Azoarcus olearius]
MPSTDRGVRIAAERQGWQGRKRPVGKGMEYAFSALPVDTRRALQAQQLELALTSVSTVAAPPPAAAASAGAVSLPAAPALADLTDRQRLERDARSGVIAAVRRLQDESGSSQEAALVTLLTTARAGQLDAALDRMLRLARDPRGRAGDGYPSVRTLKRWLSATDLAPKARRAAMTVPDWAKSFLCHYQQPQKPSVEAAYRAACEQWPAEGRPSIHQVRRFLQTLGTVTRERGRMGDRELKNIRPFVRRDFSALRPNDVWSADGHTFDAEVQHPLHGRPFRPEVTTIIDIATRRAVGWSVGLAESALGVVDAIRHAVERNGILAIFYVDNGSGFRNVEVGDEAVGLLGRLGATPSYSLPYNSQARGVIERFHKTVWVAGAKQLPAYMGAAMDREARLAQFKLTRKALKHGGAMPLMPWDLFVQWCEERIAEYNARAHRSLGNSSPDLVWAAHEAKGWKPDLLEPDELATLFRPRVVRTLARAEIRLFNNIYFARELEEFHGLEAHIAYDIHDASKVWVYAPDGRFICTADVNGNARHYFPVPVVEQARQKRAQGRLARVDTKREEILAELHGGAALPAPAAAQVVIAGRVIQPDAMLAQRAAIAQATEVAATPAVAPPDIPSIQPKSRGDRSPDDNYRDWLALDARIANGEEVSDADARWHRTYPNSAQYKAQAKKTATCAATRVA